MQKLYPKTEHKRYFCVPACIKAILSSRGLGKEIDIWTIGRELDLKIPKGLSHEYPNTKISLNENFEINLHKEKHSINNFFKRYNLLLKENYFYRIDKERIIKLIKKFQNSDILICFDYPTVANISNKRWGHISLVIGFNEKSINIQDPKSEDTLEIDYDVLSKSIQKHGRKRRGGFWIISETAHTK